MALYRCRCCYDRSCIFSCRWQSGNLLTSYRFLTVKDRQKDVSLSEYIAGFILVFISAFFLGLHYVLSDRLLKKSTVGKKGEYYASAEIALFSGLFTFLFVIIFILIDYGGITNEAEHWFPTFHNLREMGDSGKVAGISLGGINNTS